MEVDTNTYIIDVLLGQPIKFIQVASNSELCENQWKWNDLLFFEIVHSHCFRASEASNLDCFKKLSMKVLDQNFNSLLKNEYFGALIFQEIEFFEQLMYNLKTS